MAKLTQSYVHGGSIAPLIGDTIGVHFDKAAERWKERDALIVRQQGIRWSYGELKTKVDAFAAGLLALGLAPATVSASGRRTMPNGSSRNSPPPRPA
jgi:fatty-acyl-CoA synthase